VTQDYYDLNARDFFDASVDADMSELYRPFSVLMPERALILDAGCGSGRDTKAFLDMGFQVHAIDASAEMAAMASRYVGIEIDHIKFQELTAVGIYDGVWACASLLHVPLEELRSVLSSLLVTLKNGGYLYASFKYGSEERHNADRNFTDMNEQRLDDLLAQIDSVALESLWLSHDVRPGRSEAWINVIMRNER
jgi:SAM-dependent methyltransferase